LRGYEVRLIHYYYLSVEALGPEDAIEVANNKVMADPLEYSDGWELDYVRDEQTREYCNVSEQ
jgi:hypothetical protein